MVSANTPAEIFRQTCVYENRTVVSNLLGEMEVLRQIGLEQAAGRKRWGWTAFWSLFLLLPAGLAGGVVAQDNPQAGLPAFLPALVLLGFGIYSLLRYSSTRRRCFDLQHLEFAERVLHLVRTDMDPDLPLHLKLDLTSPELPAKLTGEGAAGEWKVKFYTSPWFTLRGKFLDGTACRLAAITLFQARTKTRRNARGKLKTKRKTREALRLRLELSPKSVRYPLLEEIGRTAVPAVKLPPTVSRRQFQVTAGNLLLETHLPAWHGGAVEDARSGVSASHTVAMMLLSLYQVLNLSKQIAKSQQQDDKR